jgi:hypothetical protein
MVPRGPGYRASPRLYPFHPGYAAPEIREAKIKFRI